MWFLVPPEHRWSVFWRMVAVTVILSFLTDVRIPGYIKRIESVVGIASLELAGRAEDCRAIVASYGRQGLRAWAIFAVLMDYLFILGYSTTIGLGCVLVAEELKFVRGLGYALAWGMTFAAILDMVENVALLRMLAGHFEWPYPGLASVCAWTKFVLIIVSLVCVGVGGLCAGWSGLGFFGLVFAIGLTLAVIQATRWAEILKPAVARTEGTARRG